MSVMLSRVEAISSPGTTSETTRGNSRLPSLAAAWISYFSSAMA